MTQISDKQLDRLRHAVQGMAALFPAIAPKLTDTQAAAYHQVGNEAAQVICELGVDINHTEWATVIEEMRNAKNGEEMRTIWRRACG